jgi:hypothetical protein
MCCVFICATSSSGALFMIIAQEIRTTSLRHQELLVKYQMGDGIFLSDSHFRNEKLTYPKPRTCRLTGE